MLEIIVAYALPIISSGVLVLTAIAGVVKYYKEKNRSYAEQMLKKVCAPLYSYILKQEFARKNGFQSMMQINYLYFH